MAAFKIVLHNFKDREIIRHCLLLLKGSLLDFADRRTNSSGFVEVTSSDVTTVWRCESGFFAAVVALSDGENRLLIRSGSVELEVTAILKRRSDGPDVLPVYIMWADDEGRLPWTADNDVSVDSARLRLDLLTSLIQALLADELQSRKYGKCSFILAPGSVFRSNLTLSEVRSLSAAELWAALAKELASSVLDAPGRRFLVAASNASPQGAGRLAVVPSESLGTIPIKLENLPSALIDFRQPHKCSAPPGWNTPSCAAAMAAALGAAAHELCHAFDLAHSSGLMSASFPRFASALRPKPTPPLLSSVCAALLAAHPSFNPQTVSAEPPSFQPSRRVIQSEVGLRIVQLRSEDGLVVRSWELTGSRHMIVPLPPRQLDNAVLSLFIMDIHGNISRFPLPGHGDFLPTLTPCNPPVVTCHSSEDTIIS